jgi:hypothetical protein
MLVKTKSTKELLSLAANTYEADVLFKIVDELVARLESTQTQLEFARLREKELSAQITRQVAMINKLEQML